VKWIFDQNKAVLTNRRIYWNSHAHNELSVQ